MRACFLAIVVGYILLCSLCQCLRTCHVLIECVCCFVFHFLWCVLATMKGESQASRKMQDLEEITAEISTAARARMVSVQDTVGLFARLNVRSERDTTPQ
jgi:hypothetical protein